MNHTLRPVIDELRAADPMDAPPAFPPIVPPADLVGLEPPGAHVRCATMAATVYPYDPAVDAAARGLLSAGVLSGQQLDALQQHLVSAHDVIVEPPFEHELRARVPDLPIGMIEPVDATAALASLAEAEALAYALAATVPRRPTLLERIFPTTATAFWMAVSGWLGFLLARAEGWL